RTATMTARARSRRGPRNGGRELQRGGKMAKTAAKRPSKQARTARPAKKTAAKTAPVATGTASQEAARGKLERVKVPSPSRRDAGSSGKSVYCVTRSEQPLSFGPLGLGPEPANVHTIHYRDICAVVSNTPIVVQDPTRENVLAHQRVNE